MSTTLPETDAGLRELAAQHGCHPDNGLRLIRAVLAASQSEASPCSPPSSALRDAAYDQIDRFLRNNLDDADYADYSAALDCVSAPAASACFPELTEVAAAIEQRRAIGIAEAVRAMSIGAEGKDLPTPFQSGFDLACEEIMARLRSGMGPNAPLPELLPSLRADGGKEQGK